MGSLGFHRGICLLLKVIHHTVMLHISALCILAPASLFDLHQLLLFAGRQRILNGLFGKNSISAGAAQQMYFIVLRIGNHAPFAKTAGC
ncbi:hypothetical protein [Paraflavitalea sp. CAU 1676]|uniref:hypothetical protein n=1 Tax=Paraflavitalea sp. CAU 1676 TaxID=3032598 RepID=UPI0023DBAF71|nr:hypothetical protein [Paraflavitalea sp. CAU 1676]MDF2191130.1 hypothetical protein [Paraflavitalea sp. CAU 1676]